MSWNRSKCREQVCYCHDQIQPFYCSHCGCFDADEYEIAALIEAHHDWWGRRLPVPKWTPQLYEAANAKLLRIGNWIINGIRWYGQASGEDISPIQAAYRDVERCRREVKYEYLGLKDSWL